MEEIIKLLLVEDDANLCYIIQGGLEDMIGGYEVLTASNGEEGLAVWKAQQPDVIVADIEMPVMDGYERRFGAFARGGFAGTVRSPIDTPARSTAPSRYGPPPARGMIRPPGTP